MIVEKLEVGRVYEFTANIVEMEFDAIKEWCEKNEYIMMCITGRLPPHRVYWLIPGDVYQKEREHYFLHGTSKEEPVGFLKSNPPNEVEAQ